MKLRSEYVALANCTRIRLITILRRRNSPPLPLQLASGTVRCEIAVHVIILPPIL